MFSLKCTTMKKILKSMCILYHFMNFALETSLKSDCIALNINLVSYNRMPWEDIFLSSQEFHL